ncbi:MAG: helix-turn-helix domain-containing protein [Epsilonproteobacteria bacterium]|nr:helix-turn-helix domain-containing protein [Campylobacterota bacterium]
MKKLTVSQAAEYFGITKEAIYNRVRRGKLKTVVEEGLKYVVVDENIEPKKSVKTRKTNSDTNDKYVSYLENEVSELKERVKHLEKERSKLIEEKISILEKSKKELEQIFATRDEQLKQILHLMNEKYALPKIESVEVIDTNIKQKSDKKSKKKKKNKKKKR